MPIGVMLTYGALALWAGLLVQGIRRGTWRAFLIFGVLFMTVLNAGYVINGVPSSIANFIGIYDVLINIGVTSAADHGAMGTCAGNACTVWGGTFTNHSGWATAFYDRFANGPELRSWLLQGHIVFNSIVFVLMHVQMFRPGGQGGSHKLLGRITFLCLTVSVICAVWLTTEHGDVPEYGGLLAEYGFYSMALCVYACAVMGVLAIRGGDMARHRVWMFRFVGSMWGSFWIFRVMLFVIDPIFRDYTAVAILICIWTTAPLGALAGDMIRRRIDAPSPAVA